MIRVEHLHKSFEHGHERIVVLEDLNFHLETSEFVTIIGRSGSGKSTLLDLIMGLTGPSEGQIHRSRQDLRIGYVFQKPGLLPWRTVLRNVSLPLEIQGVRKRERLEQAHKALREVGMDYAADAYPFQLSGGMAQRVAIARALVGDPELLLMDEPFSSLDPLLRDNLNVNLAKFAQRTKKTILFVTHSINEAVILSDRIVILEAGHFLHSLRIDLPRPRDFNTFQSEAFQAVVRHVRRHMPIQPNLPREES